MGNLREFLHAVSAHLHDVSPNSRDVFAALLS
jgi:hypothetical protein